MARDSPSTVQPYGQLNLGQACSYTFFAGTTVAFGASAWVGGNLGLDASQVGYSGTGLGAMTLDSSGQYCELHRSQLQKRMLNSFSGHI